VGPLAFLGVEVLGYSKMLEEAKVIAGGVLLVGWLCACLACLGCLACSSLLEGYWCRGQRGCQHSKDGLGLPLGLTWGQDCKMDGG